jgi:hypothetical protein
VNRNRLAASGGTFHHSVCVILLDPAMLRHPSILRSNPKRDPAKPCVYVGMTGLSVEHRFQNHKRGQGHKKLRSPVDARAVRIFKSDAIRSSSSDGKGFDRRFACVGLQSRRWYLGSASNSCRRIGGTDSAMAHGSAAAWGYLHLGLESSDRLGVSIARYGDDMFFGININARRIRIDAHLRPSGRSW